MHHIVLRARREEDEPCYMGVHRPRYRVRHGFDELQAGLFGQHEVELDAGRRHDDEVGDGRARPVEGEDTPPALASAALARVPERGAVQQVHELDLHVRALHRRESVVE